MKRLNSAEFKREMKSLTEPVVVTVGGKSIGIWTPTIPRLPDFEGGTGKPSEHQVAARTWKSWSPQLGRWLVWDRFEYPQDPNER